MAGSALWHNDRWQVTVPPRPLTAGHLVLVDRHQDQELDPSGAAGLLDAYRRSRSALWSVRGSRGFMISFPVGWQPDAVGIGEPDPIGTANRVVHVFGRAPGDVSPRTVMAVPRRQRHPATLAAQTSSALAAALADTLKITIPAPPDHDCDGCGPDILHSQERWRADGTRVIRPRTVLIDSQVMIMPLRHVVSLGDLTPGEVVSIVGRLQEVRSQFRQASGVTGLSCFANDGSAARQETPHVHLHVFGRSAQEQDNPFELLGRRLSQPSAATREET